MAGRRVSLKSGGRERKPLNASLPTQLVLDFNSIASRQGHGMRDALLQEVLLTFLAKTHPDSKSVQERLRSELTVDMSSAEARLALDRAKEREAIRISRDCAQKILDVTAEPGRQPPRKSPRGREPRRLKVS